MPKDGRLGSAACTKTRQWPSGSLAEKLPPLVHLVSFLTFTLFFSRYFRRPSASSVFRKIALIRSWGGSPETGTRTTGPFVSLVMASHQRHFVSPLAARARVRR